MNYQKFPFGKYKGVNIYELPVNYLAHALEKFEMPKELEEELAFYLVLNLNLHEKNHVRFTKDIKKVFDSVKQRYNYHIVDVLLEVLSNELNINEFEYSNLELQWKIFLDKLGVKYEYISSVGFKVNEFGGGGILIANADVTRNEVIGIANKYKSKVFMCGDSPDFIFYRAYNYLSKDFMSITFCGGDSNYKNISGYYVDPEEHAGETPYKICGVNENDWFWKDYIDAVLFVKNCVL
jgi:uncharacterized protein (DUF3820 family)